MLVHFTPGSAIIIAMRPKPRTALVQSKQTVRLPVNRVQLIKEGTLPSPPSSFLRMIVCGRSVLVGGLAMFVSRVSMSHCIVVLARVVKMRCLMVMMGGGMVVGGRLMVMITRRMLR
jgi:hypothetical protein